MAQKDYIKRGNPKANQRGPRGGRARNSKSTPPPTPEKKPLPLAALSVAVVVLAGFGYFLWQINGAAENAPATVQNVDVPPQTAKRSGKDEPEIPPPPKQEKWQYIEELKNKTVEVEVKKLEQKGPYLMQCATFRENRRAEAFRAQLALLGFESRVKMTESKSGIKHYRVQLGPYETNRDAQKAMHKLAKHNINGCKIWLWS